MYKCKILSIGKPKEQWLQTAISEYTRRLQPILSIDWHLTRTTRQLEELILKEKNYVALDPRGKTFTSEAFSSHLHSLLEQGGSRITFIIGGSEGLSQTARENAQELISLSPLTFTHQITRIVLLEQVYRAFEIAKGTQYHK